MPQPTEAVNETVAVALRYTLMRQALAGLLKNAGFAPVLEADSPEALYRLVSERRPAVALVEWDGGDMVTHLASMEPRPCVVVLAAPDSQKEVQAAVKAGANGFLSFNVSAEELAQTLRLLVRGGFVVSGEMASALSGEEDEGPEPAEQAGGLSGREREVLGLVASGATNREIAEALVVTENTVKVHLRNVLDKLNLRNRQQAAAFAVREGIVVDPPVVRQEASTRVS